MDLIERARAGDGPALAGLIERLRDEVYRLSLRMLWHPEDAADATQEILFKIVTSIATFRGESSVRTWALRIATNHLLNIRRSRIEEQSLTFEAFARDLADGLDGSGGSEPSAPRADEPDQALLEEEVKIGCTQAMLLCLGRDERIAYILGDVFELHSDDAAEILAIDLAAFRKRLSRARSRVRDFMSAHCGLIEPGAACSCARRVRPAIERGRIDRNHLLFAGRGATDARRLPVLEAVGVMERLHEIAALHQSHHPRFMAPRRVSDAIRSVLQSAGVQALLGLAPTRRAMRVDAINTHVLIAVTDDFPYQGADAVILRRHGVPYDQDVILVKRADAQPPLLAEAVLTLQAVRSEFGDLPNADQVVRVNAQRTPRGRVNEAVEWLKRIGDAEPRDVRGLGKLQYVRVLIPNSR